MQIAIKGTVHQVKNGVSHIYICSLRYTVQYKRIFEVGEEVMILKDQITNRVVGVKRPIELEVQQPECYSQFLSRSFEVGLGEE